MSPTQEIARRRTFRSSRIPMRAKTNVDRKVPVVRQRHSPRRAVKDRKNQRPPPATGWSSSGSAHFRELAVLQFDYSVSPSTCSTPPGHKDFSEDTYRVLTAVDAALMVIDAAKGIEPQTRKLFEVCRRRACPSSRS